ncbi:putative exported domain protein, partial [Chlamydia psittaci 84-8471/1]
MQSYIFTLLCLASLVSMVSFDAVNARKRSVYARMVE